MMNDAMGSGLSRTLARGFVAALTLALLSGCGGTQQSVGDPSDPSLDSPASGGETAPASSALVQEGMDAIQAEDYAAAKAALSQAIASDPRDPQAAYYLGVAEEGLGEVQDAIAHYRKALELDPNLLEAATNLSGALIDTEQGSDAVKVVEMALEKAPDDKNLLMNHALALELLGDMPAAVAAYGKAVEKSPDDLQLRLAYVQVLAGEKQSDLAKAQIAKLGKVSDPMLARALAQVELHLGMFDDCIVLLDGVVSANATPDLHLSRATCKYAKKDLAGAEADYRAAIALDPNFTPGHFYLGVLLQKQGKKAEAKKAFEKVAETGKGTPAEKAARDKLKEL